MSDGDAIGQSIVDRGVTELLHFTTNLGLTGIVNSDGLKARTDLQSDQYLEHIYTPNSAYRREQSQYWSYVNLSVTSINARFFDICSGKWHFGEDLFWVIVSVDPQIATHDGALFATSNMAYDGITPAPGIAGWDAMFAPGAPYGFGRGGYRGPGFADSHPTNEQAEVLYPRTVPFEYVQRVYVHDDDDAARADGIIAAGEHPVEVLTDPRRFERR